METKELEIEPTLYREGGKEYARVTQVLKTVGALVAIPFVSEQDMDFYLERGSKGHRSTELWDLGDLDEASLDPELVPRLEAWKAFRRDTGFLPTDIELFVKSDTYRIAGRLDRIGTFTGSARPTIVDIKMTNVAPSTAIQTALYSFCLPDGFHGYDRMGVALRADGTYRITQFKDRADKAVGEAAITLFHWITRGK